MDQQNVKPPMWFWVFAVPFALVGILGLLQVASVWDLKLPEPIWARVGYTVGILGVFAGGIMMILRKRAAVSLLAISIAGFLIHRFWLFFLSDILDSLPAIAPFTLMGTTIINILALWILYSGVKAGWAK